jgi:hydrogenase maturation protein HypF
MIRETIRQEISSASLTFLINREEPLGDGCVSFGQCVYAGTLLRQRG